MPSIKQLLTFVAVILLASPIYVKETLASDNLIKLPPDPVRMEAFNGTKTYFNTKLSDVPSGYTVLNGTYPGWCIDQLTVMARSPAQHSVLLYSSLNPPVNLANESWSMVNYILNHKQGGMWDVQGAIWYFINMAGNYSPPSRVSQAIIKDALANGAGFVPAETQLLAVICYPKTVVPARNDTQISIIEVTIPKSENNTQQTIAVIAGTAAIATIVLLPVLKKRKK